MRNIILLAFLLLSFRAMSVCVPLTRTDVGSGAVLTSTKYNLDLNTVYASVNSYNLACAQDGTLKASALSATEFEVVLKGIQRGCGVSYVDSDTVKIEACIASVNGNLVKKDTATNVTWANLDAGSQATGTSYWVYIDGSSSGTTVTPKLSTTGPDENGYNAGGDLALAKIRNNARGDISTGTIEYFQSGHSQKTFAARIALNTFSASGEPYQLWSDFNPRGVHALDMMSCIVDTFIIKCDWVDGVWSATPSCVVSMWDKSNAPSNIFNYVKYVPWTNDPFLAAKQAGDYNDFQIQAYQLDDGDPALVTTVLDNSMVLDFICHGY